jgi:hypothetical protein
MNAIAKSTETSAVLRSVQPQDGSVTARAASALS